tara:strand:- start:1376 stop:1669 length:294 start_codon:yes stop_codon:yes gene_type:complete
MSNEEYTYDPIDDAENYAEELKREQEELTCPSKLIDVPIARKNITAFLTSAIDVSRTLDFLVDYVDLSHKKNDKQHQEIVDEILTESLKRKKNGQRK